MAYLDALAEIASQGPSPEDLETIKRLARVAGSTSYSGAAAPDAAASVAPVQPREQSVDLSPDPRFSRDYIPPVQETPVDKRLASIREQEANLTKTPAHGMQRVLGNLGGIGMGILTKNPYAGIEMAERIKDPNYYRQEGQLARQAAALQPEQAAQQKRTSEETERIKAVQSGRTAQSLADYRIGSLQARQQAEQYRETKPNLIPKRIETTNPDGSKKYTDVNFDKTNNKYLTLQGQPYEVPDDATIGPAATSVVPRNLGQITVEQMIKNQEKGTVYRDNAGKVIDAKELSPGSTAELTMRGADIIATSTTPRTVTTEVGGREYGRTVFQANQPEKFVELGPKKVPTSRTPPLIEVGPDGTPTVVPGVSTPSTPGINRVGPASVGAAAPLAAPVASAAGSPPPMQPRPVATTTGATAPVKPIRVTQAQDTQYRRAARPMREVITQLFGDKANPGLKPLAGYGKIADDAARRTKVGTALRMLLADTSNLSTGSTTDVSGWRLRGNLGTGELLPISTGVGGDKFGSAMEHYLTLSPGVAEKMNANFDRAMNELKNDPEARELISATLKAYEAAVGMRSMIPGSSAQAAVQTIQKTLPVIGMNTFSSVDFNDKMKRWAQDGLNGVWGIPPNYFGQDAVSSLNDFVKGGATAPPKYKVIP